MKVYLPTDEEIASSSLGQLKEEMVTLRNNVNVILEHPGEWVLIKASVIIGYYKSCRAAFEEGYKRCGVDQSFLVKGVDELTRPPVCLPIGLSVCT